jgi:hypothetical protein
MPSTQTDQNGSFASAGFVSLLDALVPATMHLEALKMAASEFNKTVSGGGGVQSPN